MKGAIKIYYVAEVTLAARYMRLSEKKKNRRKKKTCSAQRQSEKI